jgi:predicted PurR-regulated permease PerM
VQTARLRSTAFSDWCLPGYHLGMAHPRPFIILLLAVALGAVAVILWGFVTPIILAILLAMLAAPVYRWLRSRLGDRANISALLVVIATFSLIVLPVSGILLLLFTQGAKLIQQFSAQLDEGSLSSALDIPILERLQTLFESTFPGRSLDGVNIADQLSNVADSAVQYLVGSGVSIFGDIADVVAKFFILLFLLFYLVRDGEQMVGGLKTLLPLREEQTVRIFGKIRDVTRAVVFGSLAIGVIQGVLGGVGVWIVGMPGLVWGTLIGVSSFIPVVGTALATVPIVAFLVINQMYWQALFFAVWATVLVGGVDNYLRPFLMRGQARMSPFYIFLAIIGGLATFGLSGLIFGPLIVAIAIVVVDIYREEHRGPAEERRLTLYSPGNRRPGWRSRRALRKSRG